MFISGCANKNAEELYPASTCDTINVKYSSTITQIISTNCINCHNGVLANGNPQVRLDSYTGVKAVADNGKFYKTLEGTTKQMPPSGRLPDCPISQVKAWIDTGSPNN